MRLGQLLGAIGKTVIVIFETDVKVTIDLTVLAVLSANEEGELEGIKKDEESGHKHVAIRANSIKVSLYTVPTVRTSI